MFANFSYYVHFLHHWGYYTVEDILKVIGRERVFIDRSGGGVTFSGGEPLQQPEFLLASLKECKESGVHTAVDTSGYAPEETLRSILPYADLVMLDVKHLDEGRHKIITGSSNSIILSNYKYLIENSNNMFIRIPVMPGINDQPEYLEELRDFIMKTHNGKVSKICLLPFHKTGEAKYRNLGLKYRMSEVEPPSAERMRDLLSFFSVTGIKVKIGG